MFVSLKGDLIMKIVSFNIRSVWDAPVDGEQSFVYRKEFILEKIRKEKPDIICFQEIIDPMYDYLRKSLTEYTFLGHGRNDDFRGEGVYTAVLNEKVDVMGVDVFWMTETPYVPASRLSGQSDCPRTCVRAKLRIENRIFDVLNLHLDHLADVEHVRKKELEIVCDYMKKHNIEHPVFILGDFNARPDSESINYFKSKNFVDLTADSGFTFHNFEGENYENRCKIDYIFCNDEYKENCVYAERWTDFNGKVFLSDHYPICCEIEM